jgi:hypothetical protein
MALTVSEIKDLLAFGKELGLQQLQTEGLVAIYGVTPVVQQSTASSTDSHTDEAQAILAHYSAVGREQLRSHR